MNLTATVATVVSGRSDLSDYITYGHCALDKGSPAEQYAAACTLAYAYDDWALAVRN
jgi:putative alpha-1,2-mannosidase